MDISEFASASVAGIPLVVFVIGAVAWLKQLGVQGRALTASSMVIGLVFGGGYQVFASGVPVDFAGWFAAVFYGLALGLVASGVYKAGESLLLKAVAFKS